MTKIGHIADIHIRKQERVTEYEKVFNNLFKTLKKEKPDIVLICGDLFHYKIDIAPESIHLFNYLINGIANDFECVIIPGNHDLLISNLERMDSIRPMLNALDNNRVHYFYETMYKENYINNISFGHFSCYDNLEKFEQFNKLKKQNTINCLLYHGPVIGSTTDVNYKLTRGIDKSLFEGWDFVFLGDIHKYQGTGDFLIKEYEEYMDEEQLEMLKYDNNVEILEIQEI